LSVTQERSQERNKYTEFHAMLSVGSLNWYLLGGINLHGADTERGLRPDC